MRNKKFIEFISESVHQGILIDLSKIPYSYNSKNRIFTLSEKDIRFGTKYLVKNPKTGGSMEFDFTESTGPEFDPNTKWIYKSSEGITLEVCNDPEITKRNAEDYLRAKTRN